MKQNGAITPKQRALIEALLAGLSVTQACQKAGVGRRTYYRWVQQPTFKAALQEAESELLASAMRRLLRLQDGAIGALAELVSDRLLPSARLQAARTILDAALRLHGAVELEARLTELERRITEIDKTQIETD